MEYSTINRSRIIEELWKQKLNFLPAADIGHY